MILKKCARCGKLMPYGRRWCDKCAEVGKREELRRADKRRADEVTAFYRSKEWLTLSKAYLQAKGYRCERCGEIAECVHHKHYIRQPGGWERRLEWGNLEALCGSCHAIEHGRKAAPQARGSSGENPGEVEKV